MARILADDEDLAMASDDLALVAHLLDRGTYLHVVSFRYADRSIRARPAAGECFLSCDRARRIRVFARGRPMQALRGLLEAVGDAAAVQVVHRQLHGHAVAGQDLDVVHAHLAGNVGEDGVAILELHLEHRVGQGFEYRALEFDYIFLSQKLLLQNGLIKQQRKIVPKRQDVLKKKSHKGVKNQKADLALKMTCLSGPRSSRAALGDQPEPPGIVRAASRGRLVGNWVC